MQYYVVSSVLSGIQTLILIPGKDIASKVTYFVNPNAKNEQDEYYDASVVFENYDHALEYFCHECDRALSYHAIQIQAIKATKDYVLTCA